jgi:Protein of unknown function (DUF3016)
MHSYSISMKPRLSVVMTAVVFTACLQIAHATAAAEVKFIKSDSFVDMPFSHSGRDDVLKELAQHFEKLAAKLPTGQTLKIDVSDIDLAGRIEPSLINHNSDMRILRGGADWPSMKFSYSVESQGKVVKSGAANINDMNYLRGFNRYSANEPLRYEKKMLDEWFRKEVSVATAQ